MAQNSHPEFEFLANDGYDSECRDLPPYCYTEVTEIDKIVRRTALITQIWSAV